MAQYKINPVVNSNGTNQGMQSLANAIAGVPQQQFDMEMEARRNKAATESAYASANASNARAALTAARQGLVDNETAGLAALESIWSPDNPDFVSFEDRSVPYLAVTGADLGNYVPAMPAFGMELPDMTNYLVANGEDYKNTFGGFNDTLDHETLLQNDAQEFEAGQNALELVAGVDAMGRPTFIPRGEFSNNNIRPQISFDEAKSNHFGGMGTGDRDAIVSGYGNQLVDVIDPLTNEPTVASGADALGQQPVLTKTQAEGLAITNPDPNAPTEVVKPFGGTSVPGTHFNNITKIANDFREGLPISATDADLYALAINSISQDTRTTKEVNGVLQEIIIPGQDVSYLPSPVDVRARVAGGQPSPAQVASFAGTPGFAITPQSAVSMTEIPGQEAPGAGSMTEAEYRTMDLNSAVFSGVIDANKLLGYDPAAQKFTGEGFTPDGMSALQLQAGEMARSVLGKHAGGWLANKFAPRDLEVYNTVKFSVVEPLLRLRSGAATPDAEVDRYDTNYFPNPGEDPDSATIKMRNLNRLAKAADILSEQLDMSIAELTERSMAKNPDGTATEDAKFVQQQVQGIEEELKANEPDLSGENTEQTTPGGPQRTQSGVTFREVD